MAEAQRQARKVQNELVFRAVNEQIVKMTERFDARLATVDLAEPIDDATFAAIERADGTFLVLIGHEDESIEQVVDRRDGYLLVVKPSVASEDGQTAPD